MTGSKRVGGAFRWACAGAAILVVIGISLLVWATFAAVIRVRVGAAAAAGLDASGWNRHGPVLLVVAAVALVLLPAAVRGRRVAALGLIVVGVGALLAALVGDAPDLRDTGEIGFVYADSAAGPGPGWYLETAGAVTLVVGGGLLAGLGAGVRSTVATTQKDRHHAGPPEPLADGRGRYQR